MYDMIAEIKALPHFRASTCSRCRTPLRIHALQIYATCPSCGLRFKCRAFGAVGGEVQDVIDAVLEWAGEGEGWEAVLERRRVILGDTERD